ncbi:unnamed protein product [Amoebophrya sp. A25]|nr:unnamed protein product [Amoebophrya sp. A25]|eukprot:GSA25T00004408001.1
MDHAVGCAIAPIRFDGSVFEMGLRIDNTRETSALHRPLGKLRFRSSSGGRSQSATVGISSMDPDTSV